MKDLNFTDYFDVKPPKLDNKRVDTLKDDIAHGNTGVSLDVIADVSVAGWYNLNKMFYLPTDFMNTTTYWTSPFPKPVQMHHDDHRDPIGRVMAAKFIDMSGDYAKLPPVKTLLSPDAPFDAKRKAAIMMMNIQKSDDQYTGLGRMRAHLKITDPDAIQKLIDGRYLTLSSGYSPKNGVFCSTCGANLMEGDAWEPCHVPGEVDEETGVETAWIPINMGWNEVSYVNHPAVQMCQNIKVGSAEMDSVLNKVERKDGRVPEISSSSAYSDEHGVYSLKSNKTWNLQDQIIDLISDDNKDNTVIEKTKGTEVVDFVPEDFDQLTDYLNLAKVLEEMGMVDRKLSTEQRKKLKAGTFCGPSRSFPCPDCSHVRAARRMLSRYKGPGDKKKILACVNKKAEAMGCDKDSLENGEEEMTDFIKSMLNTKDNYALLIEFLPEANRLDEGALDKLEEKNFLGSNRTYPAHDLVHAEACEKTIAKYSAEKDSRPYQIFAEKLAVRLDELKTAKAEADKVAAEAAAKIEAEKKTTEEAVVQLDSIKAEAKIKADLYEQKIVELEKVIADLTAANQTLTDELHAVLTDLIVDINKLMATGPDKAEDFAKKTNKELIDSIVDTVKTVKKVEPAKVESTTVPNPALQGSVQEPVKDKTEEYRRKYRDVYEKYLAVQDRYSTVGALRFLADMKLKGYLPEDVTFEPTKENK